MASSKINYRRGHARGDRYVRCSASHNWTPPAKARSDSNRDFRSAWRRAMERVREGDDDVPMPRFRCTAKWDYW